VDADKGHPPGRSYAPWQAAKTTFFAAVKCAWYRKKRQEGDFFPMEKEQR